MSRTICFLGPNGTFCHEAALRAFPEGEDWTPCSSILAVFESLERSPDCKGVVPIENSIEGGVGLTLQALLEHPTIHVTGEVVVEVEHCLVSEGTLESIVTVESHPHALPQCQRWLHENLPEAVQVAVASTALSARRAKGRPDQAGIASALAARLEGVPVLARGIQDRSDNATRFLVLGSEESPATGRDKTSIVFGAPHEKGALYRALGLFDRHDINLSRIESRPDSQKRWQYVFFADLEGHRNDENVSAALTELAQSSPLLRVLGSYPRAS